MGDEIKVTYFFVRPRACFPLRSFSCFEKWSFGKLDRSDISDKVIVIADRGYESFNNIAHFQKKGWHYIIRSKESYGIKYTTPDEDTFDIDTTITLTRRQTQLTYSQRNIPDGKRINFAKSVAICIRFITGKLSKESFQKILLKFLSPVRLGRTYPRSSSIKIHLVLLIGFHNLPKKRTLQIKQHRWRNASSAVVVDKKSKELTDHTFTWLSALFVIRF